MSNSAEFKPAADSFAPVQGDSSWFVELVQAVKADDADATNFEIWRENGRIGACPDGDSDAVLRAKWKLTNNGLTIGDTNLLAEAAYCFVERLEGKRKNNG